VRPIEPAYSYRAIVDGAVDFAIITTDGQGVITDWNAGAVQILGWTREEMLGQPVDCIFSPEDRLAGRPALEMQIAIAAGRASDERWHLRKDETRF
jgi:PAS domain S-box-containing protein